jgi:hypothetical protein
MEGPPGASPADRPDPADLGELLRRLATAHRRLLVEVRRQGDPRLEATVALGVAVALHALWEPVLLAAQKHLLDSAVADELAADHARLDEGLTLLAELEALDPQSRDLLPLAAALRDHLARHLERDERALYAPLLRLGAVPAG